jgi:hypothetical protein
MATPVAVAGVHVASAIEQLIQEQQDTRLEAQERADRATTSEGEITVIVSLNYCNIRKVYVCTTSTYTFTTFIHNNKRRLARYHTMYVM